MVQLIKHVVSCTKCKTKERRKCGEYIVSSCIVHLRITTSLCIIQTKQHITLTGVEVSVPIREVSPIPGIMVRVGGEAQAYILYVDQRIPF